MFLIYRREPAGRRKTLFLKLECCGFVDYVVVVLRYVQHSNKDYGVIFLNLRNILLVVYLIQCHISGEYRVDYVDVKTYSTS